MSAGTRILRGVASRRSLCESLERRTLLSAGTLDTTFSGDGITAFSLPNLTLTARDMAVGFDDKIVVVGSAVRPSAVSAPIHTFAILRYNTDGTPDTTFGKTSTGKGIVLTAVDGYNSDAMAVAIQVDLKVVVAGSVSYFANEPFFVIARYLPDGSLDTSFGDDHDGFELIHEFSTFTDYSYPSDLVIQQDGKILVSGTADTGLVSENTDMAVARLNADGTLDSSFGDNGVKDVGFGDYEESHAMALDYSGTANTNPNYGKIILAGGYGPEDGSSRAFAIARLTTSGDFDDTFSGDGRVTSRFISEFNYSEAQGVVVEPNGKYVIVGTVGLEPSGNHDFGIFRLNANGSGDPTFGEGNGQTAIDFGGNNTADSVIFGHTGELLVGGTGGGGLALACLSQDGILDPLFGNGGKVVLNTSSSASSMGLTDNNTFVAAGGNNFAAVRLHDRAPAMHIVSDHPITAEGSQAPASFRIVVDQPMTSAMRVYFTVTGDYSTPDYTVGSAEPAAKNQYAVINAGQTSSAPVTITAIDDSIPEFDEAVGVQIILDGSGYEVVAPSELTVLIRDNDRQISGSVYNDANANGAREPAEIGMPPLTVYIDANGNKTFDKGEVSTKTNSGGQYLFGGLAAGKHVVRIVQPAGFRLTQPIPPEDSYTVTVAAGQSSDNEDFGLTTFALITGTLFNDANGNGVKDSNETFLSGALMFVDVNKNGAVDPGEPTCITTADGAWRFYTRPPGTWRIRQIPPGTFAVTTPSSGYFDVAVTQGQTSSGHNFGDRLNSIGGTVFNDLDKDQVKDPNEPGIAGVIVWIDSNGNGFFDPGGTPNGGTIPGNTPGDDYAVTDAHGNYTITGLPGTGYNVRANAPNGYIQSLPAGGGARNAGLSHASTGNDFGLYQAIISRMTTSIVGSVFDDLNANGTRDVLNPIEPDNVGWLVWLDTNNNGKLDPGEPNQKTDGGGNFNFTGLSAGLTYHLRSQLPTGWRRTTAGAYNITLAKGQTVGEIFGVTHQAQITGIVFNDKNGDKSRQSTEAGVSGWTVFLDTNNNGVLDTDETSVQTNSTGAFTLNNLTPGANYHVRVVRKSGHTLTTSGVANVTLISGQTLGGILFGEK